MPQAALRTLVALETALHRPEVRGDPVQAGGLLHEDFLEFGRSGRIYRKGDILAHLQQEPDFTPPQASGFALKRLGPQAALLTYRTQRVLQDGKTYAYTLRSSVWQWQDGRWQMVFHQGTPCAAFEE
jgi:hypothetical protein